MINNIVHVDIGVTDLEKAKQFYGSVFRWNIFPISELPNALFFSVDKNNELTGGEFTLVSEKIVPGAVVLYFNVDDIDATLTKIEELGAQVSLKKTIIPGNHGMYAHFIDPFNNKIGIWSPME